MTVVHSQTFLDFNRMPAFFFHGYCCVNFEEFETSLVPKLEFTLFPKIRNFFLRRQTVPFSLFADHLQYGGNQTPWFYE